MAENSLVQPDEDGDHNRGQLQQPKANRTTDGTRGSGIGDRGRFGGRGGETPKTAPDPIPAFFVKNPPKSALSSKKSPNPHSVRFRQRFGDDRDGDIPSVSISCEKGKREKIGKEVAEKEKRVRKKERVKAKAGLKGFGR
ncbi:hypothetical protein Droror1_Dr00021965 [Drosera rotundifolia]